MAQIPGGRPMKVAQAIIAAGGQGRPRKIADALVGGGVRSGQPMSRGAPAARAGGPGMIGAVGGAVGAAMQPGFRPGRRTAKAGGGVPMGSAIRAGLSVPRHSRNQGRAVRAKAQQMMAEPAKPAAKKKFASTQSVGQMITAMRKRGR